MWTTRPSTLKPIEVKDDNGQTRTLRTVGDKWSYLQAHKFGANAAAVLCDRRQRRQSALRLVYL